MIGMMTTRDGAMDVVVAEEAKPRGTDKLNRQGTSTSVGVLFFSRAAYEPSVLPAQAVHEAF